MDKISTAVAALGLVTVAAFAAPVQAEAAQPSPMSEAVKSASSQRGYLYVWDAARPDASPCAWPQSRSAVDWPVEIKSACPDFTVPVTVSTMFNNSYGGAYEDAQFFAGRTYAGSSFCLPSGAVVTNLMYVYFPWDGKTGQGRPLSSGIGSQRWSDAC
ncbi:hypothetical protein [Streptomyces sp. NPDC004014]